MQVRQRREGTCDRWKRERTGGRIPSARLLCVVPKERTAGKKEQLDVAWPLGGEPVGRGVTEGARKVSGWGAAEAARTEGRGVAPVRMGGWFVGPTGIRSRKEIWVPIGN